MKYIITESQLDLIAQRYTLDKLKDMEFKKFKNRDFEFFPRGSHSADLGIESDWIKKDKSYDVLVGFGLWKEVRDMFNLTDDETRVAFENAFSDFGIQNIDRVSTIDFTETEKLMGLR